MVQYQQRYAPPAPVRPTMGKVADLTLVDWGMLGGGAIVTGAGLNGVVASLPTKKKNMNWISFLVGGVVTLVGGTAFVASFRKLIA